LDYQNNYIGQTVKNIEIFCSIAYYIWAEVSKSSTRYRSKNNFVENNFIEKIILIGQQNYFQVYI